MYNLQMVLLIVLLKSLFVISVDLTLDHNTNDDYSVCERTNCIKKCCPENHILSKKKCVKSDQYNFTVTVFDDSDEVKDNVNFSVIHNRDCKDGIRMRLTPATIKSDTFYLQRNGSLFMPFADESKMLVPFDNFCMDFFEMENRTELGTLVCFSGTIPEPEGVCSYGMIISMPFLLLTFIAYALLPDRNLHMKALMFYVINLMFSYLLLVIIQLSESQFAEATCKSLGYFCLFFFLVSFFWMNVICIDIWWGFSGLRGFTGSKKTAERKRFLFYCAYAWGMPVLHVLVVFIIDILANQNSVLKPDIGNGQCFLRRGFPELLYFYGPMAILITINIVLFAITAIKIRRIKSETAMLKKEDSKRHSYENDRQIFNLYVKLLFAMGVNWSMEIISWAVIWAEEAPEAIWYLTDFCNAIYGVFIFFIFVFKRSIWKLLKKRYYTFIGKHHLAHSMTMTNTTRVTSYSTATSTIQETAHGGDNDTSTLKHDP
ncbi:G-protein coupled receptor Mth2 isoform X5 [Tribolium castaneum]|uniref:G-protein coupled receptor Mth2 isoform X5 n=1 Tax=Tribolium castaneum TaxID=7070 RepID=UPI0030FE1CBD